METKEMLFAHLDHATKGIETVITVIIISHLLVGFERNITFIVFVQLII